MVTGPAVVARETERAAVAAFLDLPPGLTSVCVVEGEPGIGKTTIWREAVALARERGYRVLAATPAPAETAIAFAVLRDLLEDAFDEVEAELPKPQRDALAVALLRADPVSPAPEQGAIGAAFLTGVRALSRRNPTLIAVDDVHWLDTASAAVLGYALRRFREDSPVALLARRAEGDDALPLGLDRAEPERVEVLRLVPLTIGALSAILRARQGETFPRPTLRRLHELSDGNPLFALELARALRNVAAPLSPDRAPPVPGTLRELVRQRLAALPADTLDLLLVAATVARPTLGLLRAAQPGEPLELLDAAVGAGLVHLDGERLRFAHPLFAAAVVELAPPARRRAVHRLLADCVGELEERARHLALAAEGPSEEVAQLVEEAAQSAFARGSSAAAAELAAQARHLTPPERSGAARRRTLAEAEYEFTAGDTASASSLLDELLVDTPEGPERARLLSRRARLRHFEDDIGGSVQLLRQALAEAGHDAALRGEIEEGLAWGLLLVRQDLRAAAAHARSAAAAAERCGDPAALAEALAAQALTEFVLGRDPSAAMARALSLEGWTLNLRVLRHPSFAHGYLLSCADELERARAVFEELQRRAAEQGDESALPSIINHLALIDCLDGSWSEANQRADDAYELALEAGQRPAQASILAKKALVAARRGAVDDAREAAGLALAIAVRREFDPNRPEPALACGGETAIWTLGFLELSVGRPENALSYLAPLSKALLDAGIQEPGEVRCLPDEIEALIALGRLDDADAQLRRLEEWARRLNRSSTLAVAGRCRGLLLGARGDVTAALDALDAAADRSERVPLPFEHGRTLLALGQLRRRSKRKRPAREALEAARATFERLGSRIWEEKASLELSRIGGRAPSRDELTPTERRVAELVAEGKSNREVAAALVVAPKTVEFHLRHVYAKLGVRSRAQLARRLPSEAVKD